MIIDMKKISLGKSIDDNALWIVEQIPSLVKSADTTSILRTGNMNLSDLCRYTKFKIII